MRYIPRNLEAQVRTALRPFPALVPTGWRRPGKTSLLRQLFPRATYHLLEDPDAVLPLAGWRLALARQIPLAFILLSSIAPAITTGNSETAPALPADLEEIIYVTRAYGPDSHYYANFGHYSSDPEQKVYAQGGGALWRLNLRTGEQKALLRDDHGGLRDPQVYYDAGKILFSYRPGNTDHHHLYEIELDGSGLRQLTDGPYDDIEPTYLPDGGIAFCSSRCNRWVMCWSTPVAILYRCDADGGNIRPLSSNAVTENTPAVLLDGRLLYTRWEYVDRSQLAYHHLWTMNPDGTAVMTFFGNMHPTGSHYQLAKRNGNIVAYDNVPGDVAMLDARPIPGTRKVIAIFSPGHGQPEHEGYVTIVNPESGPDHQPSARRIHPDGNWRDPWPVSTEALLVARGRELHLMDHHGRTRLLHRLQDEASALRLHEPVPVAKREREPILVNRTDPTRTTGQLVLSDVNYGRSMEGVKAGEIQQLLVLEQLPGPFHNSPGFDGISLWGTFTLTRILGTVPVEPDGSAYFNAPALRSLFFVALDAHDLSVKRMQSFLTLQPGETMSCVGCHEPRTSAPPNPNRHTLLALNRPASEIQPIPDLPEIIDFRRHVQPILEQHCTPCHGHAKAEANLRLDAAHGHVPSHGAGRVLHSYVSLINRLGEVADGRNAHGNRAPRTIGSSASRLMWRIEGNHHGVAVLPNDKALIRLWIDSGAAANGSYAIMDGGTPTRPSPIYIRELQRYGILPPGLDPNEDAIDVYATDEAYWRSLWHRPPPPPTPGG
jgi:hypothetical protein